MQATSFAGASVSGRRAAFAPAGRCRHVVKAATALPPQYKAVKPVGDRVFVKVDKEEGKTVGGVLLPTVAQNKPTAGAVVAVGDAESVKLGDKVVYSKYAGTEIKLAGEEHVLLKEDDVIGVLPSGNAISKLKPMGDRVLIKRAKSAEKSVGGVLLTSEQADKPTLGEVVAIGEGKKGEDGKMSPPNVTVGATVMYSKYSGTEFDEDDTEFIVVRESDILAELA